MFHRIMHTHTMQHTFSISSQTYATDSRLKIHGIYNANPIMADRMLTVCYKWSLWCSYDILHQTARGCCPPIAPPIEPANRDRKCPGLTLQGVHFTRRKTIRLCKGEIPIKRMRSVCTVSRTNPGLTKCSGSFYANRLLLRNEFEFLIIPYK